MNKTFIKNYLMKIANSHCGAVDSEDITNCIEAYVETLEVKDWDALSITEQIYARERIQTMCFKIILDNNIHVWNITDEAISDVYKKMTQVFTNKVMCGKVRL